eukprot:1133735-Ditylum_brightwellii.AAC.1
MNYNGEQHISGSLDHARKQWVIEDDVAGCMSGYEKLEICAMEDEANSKYFSYKMIQNTF